MILRTGGSKNKKRQLKLTKIKLVQNKIETKTTHKSKETNKQKKQCSKEEINVIRQELTFPGCRGTYLKSFLCSGSVKVFWIGPESSLFSNTLISVSVRILLYSFFDVGATSKEKMILRWQTQILEFSDRFGVNSCNVLWISTACPNFKNKKLILVRSVAIKFLKLKF